MVFIKGLVVRKKNLMKLLTHHTVIPSHDHYQKVTTKFWGLLLT